MPLPDASSRDIMIERLVPEHPHDPGPLRPRPAVARWGGAHAGQLDGAAEAIEPLRHGEAGGVHYGYQRHWKKNNYLIKKISVLKCMEEFIAGIYIQERKKRTISFVVIMFPYLY